MSETPGGKLRAAEEVRRRLRLSRLVSGLTKLQASVIPAADTDDLDVVVHLSGSDPETSDQSGYRGCCGLS
jgi:hypothetical protein